MGKERLSAGLLSGGGLLVSTFGAIAFPSLAVPAAALGLVMLLAGVLLFLPTLKRKEADTVGDTYNNSGNNFGHMGPINVGRQDFVLTQGDVDDIVSKLPDGKKVRLRVVGNARDQEMGQTLGRAIQQAGHDVEYHQIGMMAPPPNAPLLGRDRGEYFEIILAPRA